MQFTVIAHPQTRRADRDAQGADTCLLLRDNWDDYSYKTTFMLIYFNREGERHDIGSVKIMRIGMDYGFVDVPNQFENLGAGYASLGQNQEYYENLYGLAEASRIDILTGLSDVIWNDDIYKQVENENPFTTSLARSIRPRDIEKFNAIIHEQAAVTPFHFKYEFPKDADAAIEVEVTPNSVPPSNVHVIVGRNGVGKTSLLRAISDLLCNDRVRNKGRLIFLDDDGGYDSAFANLITVAFSAFDEFDPPASSGTKTGIKYTYIGLRKRVKLKSGEYEPRNKTASDLRKDFIASTLTCLRSSRKPRWRTAMGVLASDPLFASLRLANLADLPQEQFEEAAVALFDAASSGHKIVLLTMTQLVELVSERTLVLIDEPEAHLHPPLAASFIRALSDLLAGRNGVAVLATHSPVIVQEVPSSCVSLFFRDGDHVRVERPTIKTFAENLGLLTREIFRVELTESGYHQLIARAVEDAESVEEAIASFDDMLGAEGRSIARALWRER